MTVVAPALERVKWGIVVEVRNVLMMMWGMELDGVGTLWVLDVLTVGDPPAIRVLKGGRSW